MFLSVRLRTNDEQVVRYFYRCREFALDGLLDNLSLLAFHQAGEFGLLHYRMLLGKPSRFDASVAFAYNIAGR